MLTRMPNDARIDVLLSFRAVPKRFQLMIVAGEPSGDAHAAALVNALRKKSLRVEFDCFGATGPLMRAEGVETIVNSDELAIMGILEVARALPKFLHAFRTLKQAAFARSPDAVVLVDWPEFNLRLATALHRRGLKIIYYISPQLWAWRPRRISTIQRDIDLLLSILPFEAEWFKARGVDHVQFVGHPLAGEVRARFGREEFCRRHDLNPSQPIVSLLPGSRRKELQRILPPMLGAVAKLNAVRPEIQCVVVVAPSRTIEETKQIVTQQNGAASITVASIKLVPGETPEALAASDAAAVASGTATLEAALLETPMVVVYKESAVNWHTLGRLITVSHYGLVNLVAGKEIARELMQNDLTAETLTRELLKLLDPAANRIARQQLAEVAQRLGEGGASERAAELISDFLNQRAAVQAF
ncbi:MAG: lipid-A-disaccharide synthase [Acidobacteria bacterium]|nr:lipid-A-disaccharide synthase [Acidobacteriota bacterium]